MSDEILIERFLGGAFEADDVVELGARLGGDAEARARFDRDLTAHRRATDVLERAAEEASLAAMRIVPSAVARAQRSHGRMRSLSASALSGWAAAAVLALVLGASLLVERPGAAPVAGPGIRSGTEPGPSEMLAEYLRRGAAEGRIVGELPTVTLSVSPADGGEGYDVVFVRRLLERATVDDLYRLGLDEHGRPAVVQADSAGASAREAL